jgi:hypothetical protein
MEQPVNGRATLIGTNNPAGRTNTRPESNGLRSRPESTMLLQLAATNYFFAFKCESVCETVIQSVAVE